MVAMNTPYDKYYRLNRLLLHLVGLWPSQDKKQKLLRTLYFNSIILMICIVEAHQLTLPSFSIAKDIKEFQLFLFCICSIFCYYSIAFKMDARKQLRKRVVADWEQLSCKEEFDIMKKYAKESENFTLFIMILLYLFGISLIAPSLLKVFLHIFRVKKDVELTLPIPLKSFAFSDDHYYLAFFLEIVAVWTLVTIGIVIFSSFLMCIKHSCALLRIITFKIYQPFKKVSEDVSCNWFNSKNRNAYEWIKEIAKHYQNAMEYIVFINSLAEKLYIIQMFVVTLIIVMNFLNLFQAYEMVQSKSTEYIYQLILSAIYMIGTVILLYINCYIGQTLIDHGTEVLQSFYQVSLYELPLNCQRVLPLMILRSSKTCAISIGGMFMASHDFFARFMNTSMSYAMVCYKMR